MRGDSAGRLTIAAELSSAGRNADARRILLDVLAVEQSNAEVFARLAIVQTLLGERTAAIETAQRALALAPDSADVQWRCGIVFLSWKSPRKAQRLLAGAVALEPDAAQYRVTLAKALIAQGYRQQALAELREALRLDPVCVEAWNMRAMIFADSGDHAQAQAAADEALRLSPAESRTHLAAGFSALATGRLAVAREQFREALRLDPGDAAGGAGYAAATKLMLPFMAPFASRSSAVRVFFVYATLMIAVFALYHAFDAVIRNDGTVALITAAFALMLFPAFGQLATLCVGMDRLGRTALRPRELLVARWFWANVGAIAVCLIAAAVTNDGALRWIAYATTGTCVLIVIYSRSNLHSMAFAFAKRIATVGLVAAAAGQGLFVLIGLAALPLHPAAASALVSRLHEVVPVIADFVAVPAVLAIAADCCIGSLFLGTLVFLRLYRLFRTSKVVRNAHV